MKIKITNLTFSYDNKKQVLNDVNLTFESGNCYVLTGKNGAGKTTLSKLIMRLLKTPEGAVTIDNEDISKMRVGGIAKKVGYIFQNPDLQFFSNSVSEEFEFPFKLANSLNDSVKQKIERLLTDFNLVDLKPRHPLTLSVGEKQRLALALTLLNEPPFLLWDEPTASIDEKGRLFVAECIKNLTFLGKGIIIITHDEALLSLLKGFAQEVELKGAEDEI
jgi:energy-coupling factor transporter ATP-binding protein EcfA2